MNPNTPPVPGYQVDPVRMKLRAFLLERQARRAKQATNNVTIVHNTPMQSGPRMVSPNVASCQSASYGGQGMNQKNMLFQGGHQSASIVPGTSATNVYDKNQMQMNGNAQQNVCLLANGDAKVVPALHGQNGGYGNQQNQRFNANYTGQSQGAQHCTLDSNASSGGANMVDFTGQQFNQGYHKVFQQPQNNGKQSLQISNFNQEEAAKTYTELASSAGYNTVNDMNTQMFNNGHQQLVQQQQNNGGQQSLGMNNFKQFEAAPMYAQMTHSVGNGTVKQDFSTQPFGNGYGKLVQENHNNGQQLFEAGQFNQQQAVPISTNGSTNVNQINAGPFHNEYQQLVNDLQLNGQQSSEVNNLKQQGAAPTYTEMTPSLGNKATNEICTQRFNNQYNQPDQCNMQQHVQLNGNQQPMVGGNNAASFPSEVPSNIDVDSQGFIYQQQAYRQGAAVPMQPDFVQHNGYGQGYASNANANGMKMIPDPNQHNSVYNQQLLDQVNGQQGMAPNGHQGNGACGHGYVNAAHLQTGSIKSDPEANYHYMNGNYAAQQQRAEMTRLSNANKMGFAISNALIGPHPENQPATSIPEAFEFKAPYPPTGKMGPRRKRSVPKQWSE